MRIVFITNRYFPHVLGGAEVTVQTLAEELNRRGHQVAIVSLSPTDEDSSDFVNGIQIYRLAVRNLYNPFLSGRQSLLKLLWHIKDVYNLSGARQVGRVLDLQKPDFVSTHNLGGLSVAVWDQIRSRGIRLIHTLHDYYLVCPKTTMFKHKQNCSTQCMTCRVLSLPKRNKSDSADVVIGISHFVMNVHTSRGFFAGASKSIVYNSRKLGPSVSGGPKTGTDDGPVRFAFFGRVEEQKGIELLLQVIGELPAQDWILKVAGDASDPGYIERLRRRFPAPNIEFVGFVRADAFFPTVDVLVVPSLWNEPLGVVAFEAWGFGVPVIVSRRGGLAEIVDDATGWIFEPDLEGDLLRTLSLVLGRRKLLSAMRDACLARRNYFVPERHADEFLSAIGAT